MCCQILNRTNNIFELVTVEPVPERLETHNKDILGSDIEGDEHRNLRLKGIFLGSSGFHDLSNNMWF